MAGPGRASSTLSKTLTWRNQTIRAKADWTSVIQRIRTFAAPHTF